MTRYEINKKYAIDVAQDSYEVWAWADGSKTPMKFKYTKKNVDKNFILEQAKKNERRQGHQDCLAYEQRQAVLARQVRWGNIMDREQLLKKYAIDAYDLGIHKKDFDPKAHLKILSVTTKKEPDGISGSVRFTKGKTSFSEPFMVYKSGNWDRKPIDSYSFPPADREALLNAVRKKLASLNIKAK